MGDQFDPPSLLPIRTWREINETGDGLQPAVDDDAEVDATGQCGAVFGTELPGESEAVLNTIGRVDGGD